MSLLKRKMADAIRFLAMDAVQAAKSGHPGMPMGMADVATILFSEFIKVNPQKPDWPDRDRFILSAGHGSMLHYALNHLMGYGDMTMEQIRNFRQLHSITAGHPEYGMAQGIETTTGPLGQGLATAVGFALAERILAARFGDGLVDHRTWVIAGDGCLQEGISHEAIDLAGHLKLGRLTVLWDDNAISIDGGVELSTSMNQAERFRAAGWHVQEIDGHDHEAIRGALALAIKNDRPSMIACKTTIGFGAPNLAGTAKTHGAPLGDEEIAGARQKLEWDAEPFTLPQDVTGAWAEAGTRSVDDYTAWGERLNTSSDKEKFLAAMTGDVEVGEAMKTYRQALKKEAPKLATRQSSQQALEVINAATDLTIGGSADLTGSNLTKTSDLAVITADNFDGRYLHYGIREHGMAAAMNGIALHGGLVPYGGTFLVFTDYARGAIRLSALMQKRVIYVMTHDSIGLGEDGPTHQPVEHLSMLRATPNLNVFRPADAVEVAEAWEVALGVSQTPSILALSRQSTPALRIEDSDENLTAKGGYILHEATKGARDVTLLATGTELALAVEAGRVLAEKHSLQAAIVSLPCWELFDAQDAGYRADVLGDAPRIAIEAATRFGWERYLGQKSDFVGMEGFGESAPAEALYQHFNITVDDIVTKAVALIQS